MIELLIKIKEAICLILTLPLVLVLLCGVVTLRSVHSDLYAYIPSPKIRIKSVSSFPSNKINAWPCNHTQTNSILHTRC